MKPDIKKLIAEMNAKGLHFNGSIRAFREEGAPPESEKLYELSFSSEEPYQRYSYDFGFFIEILGHKDGEVRMDWINSGNAPLLKQHNHDVQVGIINSAKIANSRGTAIVRFGKSEQALEEQKDVDADVRRNVSVGYQVFDMVLVEQKEGKPPVFRVIDWEPIEVSTVSMPADRTVGANRASEQPPAVENQPAQRKKENQMTELEKRALAMGLRKDASEEAVLAAERAAFIAEGRKAADSEHKQEIARRDSITAAAKMHNLEADGQAFIASGKSADEFNQFVMNKYAKGHTPVSSAPVPSAGERKDLSKFSLIKAVREFGEGKMTGLEAEMHQQGVKDARDAGGAVSGLALPSVIMNLRSNEFTVATEGTDLVATNLMGASFIDILRARLFLQKLGAKFLSGMTGNFTLPKLTAGSSVTWGTEIAGATQQLPTTGQVAFTPKRFNAYIDISKNMLLQSSVDAEMILRNDLMMAAAVGIETAAISGAAGGSNPVGILGTTGIGAVLGGTNGLAPTDAHIIDLETAVATANGDEGSMAYLTNPKVRGKLKKTVVASGQPEKVWDRRTPEAPLNGYRAEATTLVPSTLVKGESGAVCSAIIFGNFADLVIAQWGGLDILVDPYTLAKTNLTSLILNGNADVGIRNAASFAAMTDALTA